MAEAVALQVVVLHLAHALDAQRLPRQVLARAPAALAARACAARPRPSPPTARHGCAASASLRSGSSSCASCFRALHRERRRHADVVQRALVVAEAEQQRADERPRALLVPAEARHHAVGGARVLHLDHRALARLVGRALVLGDDAVEPGALEAVEPLEGQRPLAAAGREVDAARPRRRAPAPAARGARPAAGSAGRASPSASRSKATNDAGRLGRQLAHPRRRRVQAHLQRVEVEPALADDHDLAVDHAALGQALAQERLELGEIAAERLQVAALDVELVAVAKHDGAEAVPLRLEQPARRPAAARSRASPASARPAARSGSPRSPAAAISRSPPARAAMRPSAVAQPASKRWPGSSRSITSGAWSDGVGLPLRASRSISAQTVRSASGRVAEQVVDAHAEVLVEVPRAVVPPGVAARLGVVRAVDVDEPPARRASRTPLAPAARRGFRRGRPAGPTRPRPRARR